MNKKDVHILLQVALYLAYGATVALLAYFALVDDAMGNFVKRNTWASYGLLMIMISILLYVFTEGVEAFGAYASRSVEEDSYLFRKYEEFREWSLDSTERLHDRIDKPDPVTTSISVVFLCIPIGLSTAYAMLRPEDAKETMAYFGAFWSIATIFFVSLAMSMLAFILDLGRDASASDE